MLASFLSDSRPRVLALCVRRRSPAASFAGAGVRRSGTGATGVVLSLHSNAVRHPTLQTTAKNSAEWRHPVEDWNGCQEIRIRHGG